MQVKASQEMATKAKSSSVVMTSFNAVFSFLLPAIGTVVALVMLPLGRVNGVHLLLFVVGFVLTGLGITIGYHRLVTHRSFETHPALKAVLLVLGSMAVQGCVVDWVANHVKHHAYADRPGDPHTPSEGFLHSHWGWLLRFGNIDVNRFGSMALRDRITNWVSDTFMLWAIVGYLVPFLIAGWEGLIWGGLFRQFAFQNTTFAVNSVCHCWGRRPFTTNDTSRNNWVVALLSLGEGWHNNHHAFPTSAYHGLRWWEVDLSGRIIRLLEALRLAWNVRRPAALDIQLRRLAAVPIATTRA